MAKSTYSSTSRAMNPRHTTQSQPAFGKNQVQNNARGYVFEISKWEQLKRFLILGSEGGTYYVAEQKLTKDNAKNVLTCINENGKKVVDMVVDISDKGRAPKNDPALFVLAMCAGLGDNEVRSYALAALPKVARIGTHLFHFADYVQNFRRWGHGLRSAIANWYLGQDAKDLAYQLVKYQSRDGWSNRDLIRKAHPYTEDAAKNLALRWAVRGVDEAVSSGFKTLDALEVISAFERVKSAKTEREVAQLVSKYRLPLEAIPTEKQTRAVLAAAFPHLGITAMIRNLGRYSKEGILSAGTDETKLVIKRLGDMNQLKKGRVHPLAVLVALKTYQSGRGMRGSSTWTTVSSIVDALDEAFYLAFGVVEPTGKRILIGLDVSGSMGGAMIGNMNMSAREAAAAMVMVTARSEKDYEIVGFTSGGYGSRNSMWPGYNTAISPLDITPRRRLDDIVRYTEGLPFGGTDCALPMIYAKERKKKFDAFIIYTDSETWAGNVHPFQALKEYRASSGIDARLIVVGMTATKFSIADPSDAGMLDVVGFDTAAPNVMSDFIRGEM